MSKIVSTQTMARVGTPAQELQAPPLPALEPSTTPDRILVRHVIQVTAEHFGTTPEALVSERRTQPLVQRRQIAMYLACEMTGRGSPFIGYYMGKRNHATILHGARTIKRLLDGGQAETVAAVNAIKQRLPGFVGPTLTTPGRIKVCHVIKATAEYFRTSAESLISDRMTQPLVHYRQVAMYVACEMTGRNRPFIAYYMGNRSHKTIEQGARVIKGSLDAGNAEIVAAVSAIKERLQVLRTGRA
jgi:chromosomal replication initiation ATPase DnaA